MQGNISMTGTLGLKATTGQQRQRSTRRRVLFWHAKNWLQYRWRELPFYAVLACLPLLRLFVPALHVLHSATRLRARIDGEDLDFGVVGRHLVVTAGKNYVAGAFDGTNVITLLKFHGFGTGTTAAAITDVALQTELTTQYAVASTRPTGSQAHLNNTYTTVGTVTPGSGGTIAVTEWGLLTQAATGGGTLYDHQVFAAVSLNSANGDSLQATYTLTLS